MRARVVGLALTVAAALHPSPAQAATLTYETIANSPTELWFDVSIVGVADLLQPNTDLYAYSFDVSFIASAFSSDVTLGIVEGPFLSNPDSPNEPPKPTIAPFAIGDLSSGLLTIFSSLLTEVPGATQDGMLARLVFSGVRTGDPSLVVGNAVLARYLQETVDFVAVPVEAQPVPEPSTLALLGIGLAAMARKKLKRPSVH